VIGPRFFVSCALLTCSVLPGCGGADDAGDAPGPVPHDNTSAGAPGCAGGAAGTTCVVSTGGSGGTFAGAAGGPDGGPGAGGVAGTVATGGASAAGAGGAGADTGGAGTGGTGGAGGAGGTGIAGSAGAGSILSPGRNATEFVLDAALHPQGVALFTRVYLPGGGTLMDEGAVFPVAFGYHGSGGLNVEAAIPGNECTQVMEKTYQEMTDFLTSQGVAVVWVDSFYSRDHRFCEDNTPEFKQFAPPVMDSGLSQVVSRVYDTTAAEAAFCSFSRLDCARLFRIGTSEGGTAALLPAHRFLDHSLAQLFDPGSKSNKLPSLTHCTYAPLPAARPEPRFVVAISPGCGFEGAIPFSVTGATEDLFYPAQNVFLELGGLDTVPAECSISLGKGRRELQAAEVQKRESISEGDFRYRMEIFPDGHHALWDEQKDAIKARLLPLIQAL
jgi:hypothetical protein